MTEDYEVLEMQVIISRKLFDDKDISKKDFLGLLVSLLKTAAQQAAAEREAWLAEPVDVAPANPNSPFGV